MKLVDRFFSAIHMNDDDDLDDGLFEGEADDKEDDLRSDHDNDERDLLPEEDDIDIEELLKESADSDPVPTYKEKAPASSKKEKKNRRSGFSFGNRQESRSTERASGTDRKKKHDKSGSGERYSRENTGDVKVLRPSSMEDTEEIADAVMAGRTVILNLEGLNVDVAQRIFDFISGVCYSLDGHFRKITGCIFILTPGDVNISGDIQDFLATGEFDFSDLRTPYL